MATIEIAKDEVLADEAHALIYLSILNGIVYDCHQQNGFTEGYRNQVAVDLTVAAHMLGLDPDDVLQKLVDAKVIDLSKDDEDTFERVRRVMQYSDRFSWDYMIDPDAYLTANMENDGTEVPITFTLS
jgi:hypothetical protein